MSTKNTSIRGKDLLIIIRSTDVNFISTPYTNHNKLVLCIMYKNFTE